MKRTLMVSAALAATVGIGAAAITWNGSQATAASDAPTSAGTAPASRQTAKVERRQLVKTKTVKAVVQRRETWSYVAGSSQSSAGTGAAPAGTNAALPATGAAATGTSSGAPSGTSSGAAPNGAAPSGAAPSGASSAGQPSTVPAGAAASGAARSGDTSAGAPAGATPPSGATAATPGSTIPSSAAPEASATGAAPSSTPAGSASSIPGSVPGASVPGSSVPNSIPSSVPNSSIPGTSVPGSAVPGSTAGSVPDTAVASSIPPASIPPSSAPVTSTAGPASAPPDRNATSIPPAAAEPSPAASTRSNLRAKAILTSYRPKLAAKDVTTLNLLSDSDNGNEDADDRPTSTATERADGVITKLPDPGSTIQYGQALYEVNSVSGPVLLQGELPAWRRLSTLSPDAPDVRQLENNLRDLGYASSKMKVDDHFDWRTYQAVQDWQEANGWERTGAVERADVVYSTEPIRIADVQARVGASNQGQILSLSTVDRALLIDLELSDRDLVQVGSEVSVKDPNGKKVASKIVRVAQTATTAAAAPAGGGGLGRGGATADAASTIEVEVALPDELDLLDGTEVDVELVSSSTESPTTVPIKALLALAEGGYAVEVVLGDGTTKLRAVQIGDSIDGWVAVTGDIKVGDTVVVAK